MKIIVDKMPTKPSECFYAHDRYTNSVTGREHGTCWARGDSDWSTEVCALGYDMVCPYLIEYSNSICGAKMDEEDENDT